MKLPATNWRSALAVYMQVARRDANAKKSWRYGFSGRAHAREIGAIQGMKLSALYDADDSAPETIAARDAFTAAQNELNFLFGRYQERT